MTETLDPIEEASAFDERTARSRAVLDRARDLIEREEPDPATRLLIAVGLEHALEKAASDAGDAEYAEAARALGPDVTPDMLREFEWAVGRLTDAFDGMERTLGETRAALRRPDGTPT